MMFCVECGKEEVYKDGVCVLCYIKNSQFTKGPEIIDITSCSLCSAFKFKNTWIAESFEEALKRHIRETFSISKELQQVEIQPRCNAQQKTILCSIDISGYIQEEHVIEHHTLQVRLKKTSCDVCSKQSGGYYEATIQIRAENRKLTTHELDSIDTTVQTIVRQMKEKGNRGLFITDQTEEHGGLDYYLSDKGAALNIVKTLQDTYGGSIKQSSTNTGMKDSRQVYRMTYLLRLPEYQVDDFIQIGNRYYLIRAMHKSNIHTVDLMTWEEHVFDGMAVSKIKICGTTSLIKEMIVVSQSDLEIQAMDQTHYKTVDIKKPKPMHIDSTVVSVVELDDVLFLVPGKKEKKK